ncbi:MAG: hypothetical protein U5R06_21545 [candidate division KSB1 bacterium]|nr:hypothetical protein [candidate division KSB1 bacterium]
MLNDIQPLTWNIGWQLEYDGSPEKHYPAVVPGAVQLDVAAAEHYEPFFHAENWKQFLWMEDVYWLYTAEFEKPQPAGNERLFFVSRGIDYQFEIRLNGRLLWRQEGMFTPVELDLTSVIKSKNTLTVLIFPVPKAYARPLDKGQAAGSVKPAVSYGWDWHPRLVPLGIWDETGLQVRSEQHVRSSNLRYTLSADFSQAELICEIEGHAVRGLDYQWSLLAPDGTPVVQQTGRFQEETLTLSNDLQNPLLWWTHDHGTPHLYTSVFQIYKNGALWGHRAQRIGFKQVRLVMNTGAWDEPQQFPKTQSVPPMQLELNGRRIFCKGCNWVNPEIFPGVITAERYQGLLEKAKKANFNMLRVWGGGIVNKESFYSLCDEKGILIWQEFPLACNAYPDSPVYLKVLEQESESIIRKLRNHACLALWCGGNEAV